MDKPRSTQRGGAATKVGQCVSPVGPKGRKGEREKRGAWARHAMAPVPENLRSLRKLLGIVVRITQKAKILSSLSRSPNGGMIQSRHYTTIPYNKQSVKVCSGHANIPPWTAPQRREEAQSMPVSNSVSLRVSAVSNVPAFWLWLRRAVSSVFSVVPTACSRIKFF